MDKKYKCLCTALVLFWKAYHDNETKYRNVSKEDLCTHQGLDFEYIVGFDFERFFYYCGTVFIFHPNDLSSAQTLNNIQISMGRVIVWKGDKKDNRSGRRQFGGAFALAFSTIHFYTQL